MPEQKRARWERWYAKAKQDPAWRERRTSAKRASYERTKAKRLATAKAWAAKNRDKVQAISKRFYANHIEAERQRSKQRTTQRRDAIRKWAVANPLKRAANEARRRALKRQTATGHVDYAAVVRASGGRCALCGEVVMNEPAHIDHIVPLARGGSHTQNNLQFTHGRCNTAKGVRLQLAKVG